MSAGGASPHAVHTLDGLAPQFREALVATLAACRAAGMDAIAFETTRSDALAQLYHKRGRPPTAEYPRPVTNAPDASWTWHGYSLAADIISESKEWDAGEAWFAKMATMAKAHGLKWGGDWKQADLPHVQWGRCKASPSKVARDLYHAGQVAEVWRLVGAA